MNIRLGHQLKLAVSTAFGAMLLSCLNPSPAFAEVIRIDDNSVKESTGLPVCEWQDPTLTHKATVVLVHGLTQHGSSLEPLARNIASKGYTVYSIDQRGHGYWHFGQPDKKKGFFCDFQRSTQDVVQLARALKDQNSSLPTYCIGESCGAAIIAKAAVKAPDAIDGLVLCSAGVKGCHFKTSWILHDLVSHILRINHPFDIMRYQEKYASDNQADLPESLKDPWIRRKLSGLELLHVKNVVLGTARVVKHLDQRLALLIVQGDADHVLRPNSVMRILHNAPTQDKEVVMVPGCGHVMLGTNHLKPLVVSSIDSWLDQQTSTKAVARANTTVIQ